MSLSAKQSKAVELLASGYTIIRAADLVGITPRQLHRWREDPEFCEAVQALTSKALELAEQRLTVGMGAALDALQDVLNYPDLPGQNIKRLAAVSWVELALKVAEIGELERRLTALEAGR